MKNREDFSELNEQELEDKYKHFKEELFNLRFQAVTGQLANPAKAVKGDTDHGIRPLRRYGCRWRRRAIAATSG